jgi:tetratricopeptide (TPR) repeat protein
VAREPAAEGMTRGISILLALAIASASGVPTAWAAPAEATPTETAPADTPPPEGDAPPPEGDVPAGDAETPTGEAGVEGPALVLDPKQADLEIAARLYEEGSDAFETGRYEDAIGKFQEAFELSREPQLLFNLGQAHWKWFDTDPQIDHLRQAAIFFRNYDKRMRLTEGYNPTEVDTILKAIEAQIENEERKIAERNRPVVVAPSGPTEEELRREQRRRVTRGLNISGTTTIVVGGLVLGLGVAGLLTRLGYKVVLDNASNEENGGVNLATAEEDAQRRRGFSIGGEIAFAGLITAAIVLPVGIALRVTGAVRDKRDREEARRQDNERERLKATEAKPKVSVQPDIGGLTIRF